MLDGVFDKPGIYGNVMDTRGIRNCVKTFKYIFDNVLFNLKVLLASLFIEFLYHEWCFSFYKCLHLHDSVLHIMHL